MTLLYRGRSTLTLAHNLNKVLMKRDHGAAFNALISGFKPIILVRMKGETYAFTVIKINPNVVGVFSCLSNSFHVDSKEIWKFNME